MSSDLFVFEGSFFRHSTSPDNITNMATLEPELNLQFFYSDPFFPFEDHSSYSSDLLHFPTTPLPPPPPPPPPPSHELNNLSLDQTPPPLSVPATNGVGGNFSVLDAIGVKSEENFIGLDSFSPTQRSLLSYNTEKMMQRSFSSQSLDRKPGFFFQPRFNSLIEASNFQNQALGSPENGGFLGHMRRVCSTGDLQRIRGTQLSSSPLASESSSPFMEESNFKVRRYSAEERKQRIHRYRSKRTQRNFNKTIKYACRKMLADSRPRVRGRFARNDETGEIPKVAGFNRDEEDEDELWVDGFHEEEEDQASMVGAVAATGIFNNFSPSRFQYLKF